MIRIRYARLPEGLHATAVARSRHTTIYLRPGLEPRQRRDALQRLRRNARLGYAPPLPAIPLARAQAADHAAGMLRTLLAVLHRHPLGALGLAGMLAGAAVSYTTLVTCPGQPCGTAPVGGAPAIAGAAGGAGLVTGALAPLAVKPGFWRIPEARPRTAPGAGGRAALTPGRAVLTPGRDPGARPRRGRQARWWWQHEGSWRQRLGRRWRKSHHLPWSQRPAAGQGSPGGVWFLPAPPASRSRRPGRPV